MNSNKNGLQNKLSKSNSKEWMMCFKLRRRRSIKQKSQVIEDENLLSSSWFFKKAFHKTFWTFPLGCKSTFQANMLLERSFFWGEECRIFSHFFIPLNFWCFLTLFFAKHTVLSSLKVIKIFKLYWANLRPLRSFEVNLKYGNPFCFT